MLDRIKATSAWGFVLLGLIIWLIGVALVASEKVVPTLGVILGAVGAVLVIVGPIIFWLALVIWVIEVLLALFKA